MDKIEWRHLKAIDRTGTLLPRGFRPPGGNLRQSSSIRRGVPRTPATSDPLLSSLHKLYSGVLAQKLTTIATTHGWLSAEQKGFLPGVRGIQEHTFLLQTRVWQHIQLSDTAIVETKKKQDDLTIAWMDLTNGFGSTLVQRTMDSNNSWNPSIGGAPHAWTRLRMTSPPRVLQVQPLLHSMELLGQATRERTGCPRRPRVDSTRQAVQILTRRS
ncbi:hypothetical protein EGW08_007381 [Elysia chlorotica]|uniref:Reverse transcriptase domain-containing protein n=1 Tax=Elysia chlorotica TaxID=188477 RepID=A0A433TTF9_ELYCH|nr:hypothetical protein EGW08_007381 [Elysia chlorotica]